MKKGIAYVDGGSRGNPGIAGYGVSFLDEAGQAVASLSVNLGIRTNNFAEYSALIAALKHAKSQGYDELKVFADSELLVKQIHGTYKVKSPDLRPLYDEAKSLISSLRSFSIHHVPREQNRKADRLANLAMDQGQISAATPHPAKEPQSVPTQKILAVYQNGCFHPERPVEFPHGTRCQLTIKPID
jgi:probable phosphoglycerate mutase